MYTHLFPPRLPNGETPAVRGERQSPVYCYRTLASTASHPALHELLAILKRSAGGERGSVMAMRGAITGITSTRLDTVPHVARAGAL